MRAFLGEVVVELVIAKEMAALIVGADAVLAELIGDAFALCRQFAGIDERLDSEEERGEEGQSVENGGERAESSVATEDETHGDGAHGENTRAASHGVEHLLSLVEVGYLLVVVLEHLFEGSGVVYFRQQRLDGRPVEEIAFVPHFDAVVLCHACAVHLHAVDEGDVLHLEVFKCERAVVVECEAKVLSANGLVDALLLSVADVLGHLPLVVVSHEMEPGTLFFSSYDDFHEVCF